VVASTLAVIAQSRGLSQADLARAAGVSRQAVSKWFRNPRSRVALRSDHLKRLADTLGVSADVLLSELPGLTPRERDDLAARLLWDGLYADVDELLVALLRSEPRAVARVVEAYGLYRSAKMLGKRVWKDYPALARYIHPARRNGLDVIHEWRTRQVSK
jgi:transcriptional regulator with XRE-family HTH domain